MQVQLNNFKSLLIHKTFKMKHNLQYLFLFFVFILIGCSNDNDSDLPKSDYYISFDVNNKNVEYTSVISASRYDNLANGIFGVGLSGADSNNALLIYLYDTASISIGNYTGDIIPNKYIIKAMISFGTQTEGFTSAATNISNVAKANVTVTAITDTYIEGTFSGTLVSNSDYNTITHTIKNGEFKLKFLKQ